MADFEQKKKRQEDLDLLPGITEYLESVDDNIPVTTRNLEEVVAKTIAYTGLPEATCEIIIRLIFQEIRNEMLKGNTVMLKELGRFFISKKNKIKVIRFRPFKDLLLALNKK